MLSDWAWPKFCRLVNGLAVSKLKGFGDDKIGSKVAIFPHHCSKTLREMEKMLLFPGC